MPWPKGRKHSDEEKLKISASITGKKNPFYGRKHTKESIAKMSKSHLGNKSRLGMPHLESSKKKMSKAHEGNIPWNKGKNGYKLHYEESKQKISVATKGENNPNWQGGISYEPYGSEFNDELKLFIRERDNFKCKMCDEKENGNALDVHHIDYNKKNNTTNNLVALCHSCHTKTGFNRKQWIEYFRL